MKALTASITSGMHARMPQPLISILTAAAAVLAFYGSMFMPVHGWDGNVSLACSLVAAFILTRQLSIHIRSGFKVVLGSVPLFLMVALLTPPLAIAAAASGKLLGEWSTRKERGLYLSDIVTDAGRWAVVAFVGSCVAHMGAPLALLPLMGAAAVLLAGDILTSPLVLGPIVGERPLRIVSLVARDAGLKEAAQYSLGLVAAGVAAYSLSMLALLGVTAMAAGFAAKYRSGLHLQLSSFTALLLSPRVLVVGFALGVNVLGGQLKPATASADIAPCRNDPIVRLSNGVTISMSSAVYARRSNVKNIVYVLHAPAGTTVTHVTYTGAVKDLEKLVFYADNQVGAYDSSTKVSLVDGAARVTAQMRIFRGQGHSVAGQTGRALKIHLEN